MAQQTALIVGALGVTGRALLTHLEDQPDWEIIAVSRRAPDFPTRARFISADLTDAADCRAKLGGLSDVTHIFYTAYSKQPSVPAEIPVNLGMLENMLDAVEPVATGLQHVQLMLGAKWYGTYLGSYKTPAREVIRAPCRRISITPSKTGWKSARPARPGTGRRSAPTGFGDFQSAVR